VPADGAAVDDGEGEARDAAIMFVDMRGFTPLSRSLPPHDVMMLLGEYQGLMVPIIQGHGGSIDKFLGDGILASFGAAVPSERPAAEALTAADALAQAAEAWARARRSLGLPAPEIGMGIAVGPVLFGAIGDPTRLEFTVIGDAVNLAAKLEKHTKALGVRALTTADALSRAEAEGLATGDRWTRSAERMVDGVPAPLDLASYARELSNS
jgi:adenylate cyclase